MAIKKILTEPDPFLRQKSKPVEKVNDEIRSLMDDMLETMYAAPGIGLAAVQIGVPKRIIVIDLSKGNEKKNPMYFVNPEILKKSEKDASYEEGCLSVPNQFAEVSRPDTCKVKYLDYEGKEKILETISKNNIIEDYYFYKNYPSKLVVKLKKTKFLAVTKKNGINFYLFTKS